MSVQHLPAGSSAAEIHAVLQRDAAVIVDDLADVAVIDRIADEMAPFRVGSYALGYIDDVRDPIEAVRGRSGSMSFGVNPTR